MTNRFLKLLNRGGPILADGSMGTMLMSLGLLFGDPPETWNVDTEKSQRVRSVHRGYLDAGSDLILTNSFGGTRFRLKLHNLQDQVFELNRAAAALARLEAGETAVVAGSMGPTGELFEPMGHLTYTAAMDGFTAQAEGLAAGGADVLWIETMSDLQEVRAAVEGAQRGAPGLPVVATMTFDTRGFTMMGVSPGDAVNALAGLGLAAAGGNCGNGPAEIEGVIHGMYTTRTDLPLIAKSNAGMPRMVDGDAVYDGTPEIMAEYARRVRALGATIIGACCGSTPAHIRAMAEALHTQPELNATDITLAKPAAVRKDTNEPRRAREERRARRG